MEILDQEIGGVQLIDILRWGLKGLAAGLIVSLGRIIYGEARQVPWGLFKEIEWLHLSIILLSLLFIAMKSLALHYSTHDNASPWFSAKVFILSTFNSIATFTGKIGEDTTKWLSWNTRWQQKAGNLLRFRITAIIAAILVWGASYQSSWLTLLGAAAPIIIAVTMNLKSLPNTSTIIATGFHILSYTFLIAQGYILFSSLGIHDPLLPFYLATSFFLGVLSLIPLGVGVREFTLTYFLQSMLPAESTVFALIILRLESELLTSLIGAGIATKEYIL